ncbi:MAG: LysR family transcriptional regulator [Flavobacteriales bacterium]|nr:LysR family transcriptional regulator [Flavobacteriales bacterium]
MGQYTVRNRLWILKRGQSFLGEGRVGLLRAIQSEGSITGAARSMGMSYKKAWEQVERMNSLSDIPLVITRTGGSGGGGTEVTEEGLRLIAVFDQLQRNCRIFLDHEGSRIE